MHDGESMKSALCPWMSRYCVLYDETRPHNSMKEKKACCWMQLPKLIIIRVNKYSCKYSLDDYHYELGLLVNWKRTAYQFQINRPAYSQPSLKRREEEKIRIKDEKRRLHFVSPPKYPLDREGSMIWNWTFFQQPLYAESRRNVFMSRGNLSQVGI